MITGIGISAEACWSMKEVKKTTADSRRTAVDPRWRGETGSSVAERFSTDDCWARKASMLSARQAAGAAGVA